MKDHFNKSCCLFLLGVGLSILWLFLMAYFNALYTKQCQEYLDQRHEIFIGEINSIINSYEAFSNYIFDTMIDNDSIRDLMLAAQNGDEIQKTSARARLYEELYDDYQVMVEYEFKQMQFHLPDGESFLRFHAPQLFGDDLLPVRESIRLVSKNHEYLTGFEEGRVFNGYRFVYPLMDDQNYLGSVEVSISLGSVIEGLYRIEANQDYGFLLQKEVMENTVFEEEQSRYQDSLISDDYVVDIELYKLTMGLSNYPQHYEDEEFLEIMKSSVSAKMKTGESFMTMFSYQGDSYLGQFEQIRDISGKAVGYFFMAGKDSQIYDLGRTKDISSVLTTLIYFMLLLMLYYVKQWNDTIAYMAMYDQLTRIYNRHSFFEIARKVLASAKRRHQPVCLAILDIDYFKLVNDQYGHHTGDLVLRDLAQIINRTIRNADILGRFGGEEFILLLSESDLESSKIVAERIRKAIEDYRFDQEGQVTISIGLVEKSPLESIEETIIRADEALYLAKERGRNQTVVKE